MSKRKRMPLCGTPEQEFAAEARESGRHAAELVDDGESPDYAVGRLNEEAASLALFYELPAADYAATACAELKRHAGFSVEAGRVVFRLAPASTPPVPRRNP